jgi:hypothetical protein
MPRSGGVFFGLHFKKNKSKKLSGLFNRYLLNPNRCGYRRLAGVTGKQSAQNIWHTGATNNFLSIN